MTTTTLERKDMGVVTLKDADDGTVESVIAKLNVVDAHGDMTRPGFFGTEGVPMAIVESHDWGQVQIGKGVAREEGEEVVFRGKINLAVQAGAELRDKLKFDLENPPPLIQWSYGFALFGDGFKMPGEADNAGWRRELVARPDGSPGAEFAEVSPVMKGAGGKRTRTMAVKTADDSVPFAEQLSAAVVAVEAVKERAIEIAQLRATEGKEIGAESKERIGEIADELDVLRKALTDLTADPDRDPGETEQAAHAGYARYQALRRRAAGLRM